MSQVTVLVIDPEETTRHFLRQMLQKKEFIILEASNGKEGLGIIFNLHPAIVISETTLPDYTVGELITRMHQDKHTAGTPLIVLTSNSDPDEMDRCLKAGAAEYYLRSVSSIITMINAISQRIIEAKQSQPGDKKSLLCVFVSAKGGTGTSSLCANLGMAIAKNVTNSTVAVLDMVLPIGSMAQLVGYDEEFNLIQVSNLKPEEFTAEYFEKQLIVQPNWSFHLLPGAPDPEAASHLKVDTIPEIIKALRANYDYVLVDFGRTLSRISLPIIQQADAVVLVMSTDLSTIALTRKTIKYFEDHGVKHSHLFPLLNRAVGLEGLSKAEAEKILNINIRLTMPYMMSNFTLANNQHLPILTKFPTDTASLILKQGALEISEMAIKNQQQEAS